LETRDCPHCGETLLPQYLQRHFKRCEVLKRKRLKEVRRPRLPQYDIDTLKDIGPTAAAGLRRLIRAWTADRAARTAAHKTAAAVLSIRAARGQTDDNVSLPPEALRLEWDWVRAMACAQAPYPRMSSAAWADLCERVQTALRIPGDLYSVLIDLGREHRGAIVTACVRRGMRAKRGYHDLATPIHALLHLYRTNPEFAATVARQDHD